MNSGERPMKPQFEGSFEKRGDDYFFVLPAGIEEHFPLKRGDKLKMTIKDGQVIMEKAEPGEEYAAEVL